MKKQIIILVLFLVTLNSFSQNYHCINSNTTHYFEDSESIIKVIQIDSVVIDGENQHYYNYPTFALTDDFYCFTQYGPSWIGRKMTEVINGDNVFYNMEDEPITIKTLSDLGDEWTCYEFISGNYITATLTEIQSMEFLGLTDMVKKITFQVKEANGTQISHQVNNMFLLLSENYGLIQTLNFKVFPDIYDNTWYDQCHEYALSGIEENEAGTQNLTIEKIFDMNVGDEYHTEDYSYIPGMASDRTLLINNIIAKESSAEDDTLFYQAARCGKREIQQDTIITISYIQDTVELVYDLSSYSYLDSIPEKIITDGNEDYREYTYNTQWRLNNSEKMVKENWFGFYSSFPHDCIEMIITDQKNPGYEQFYFIEGLGGPYWHHEDILNWENYRKVLYYKTATEEWGEPLNCDSLMVNIEKPLFENQKVFFAPNPMTEKSILKFSNPKNEKCSLVLYDMFGKRVRSYVTTTDYFEIRKNRLSEGLYIYKLLLSNQIISNGKIMVQ